MADQQQADMETLRQQPLSQRIGKFILVLCTVLVFVYGVLPLVTSQVPILDRMRSYLDNNGIDPTRYFYTDVEQVAEGERYLRQAIRENDN